MANSPYLLGSVIYMPSPTCPRCNVGRIHSNGKTSSGAQRLRCKSCGFTLTASPSGHGGYRHGTVGGTPAAERMRKSRERRRAQPLTDDPA